MRIVIELKRGEVPEVILNNLYKHTQLQQSFGVIMLAIVSGRPKVLNLAELVESFVDFRREVVVRRTQFELRKAEARYHILEGLKIALDHLDAVIKLIRASKTVPEAREGLITQFSLSQVQAQAILDMQLQRLTGLERQKILDEMAELLKTIERLRAILGSETLLMQTIVDELKDVQRKYGDDRRTEIIEDTGELSIEDLIAEEDMAITVSNTGYIKRTPITSYRNQRRGGKGPHRHAHARRRFRQPPLRGVHARLHHDFFGPRARVLAEGARNSGRRAPAARAKRLRTWCRWRPTSGSRRCWPSKSSKRASSS